MTGRSCGEQINAHPTLSVLSGDDCVGPFARMELLHSRRVDIEEGSALPYSSCLDQLLLETRFDRDGRPTTPSGAAWRGYRRGQHLSLPLRRVCLAVRRVSRARRGHGLENCGSGSRIGTMFIQQRSQDCVDLGPTTRRFAADVFEQRRPRSSAVRR